MTKNKNAPLLPDRHMQLDFFLCDLFTGPWKDDAASMEHPIFMLKTNLKSPSFQYIQKNLFIEVFPSRLGYATIFDKDILLFAQSQIFRALQKGKMPNKVIQLNTYDFLASTNRAISSRAYEDFTNSLNRLAGTLINTNITTGKRSQHEGFHLVEKWSILSESINKITGKKRILSATITLSDWLFEALLAKEVLTLPYAYFRLRKALERRIYELCRKHCGNQREWKISIENLQRKVGSTDASRNFFQKLKKLCADEEEHQYFPDYSFCIENKNFVVRLRKPIAIEVDPVEAPTLNMNTYEKAKAIAPGWDVYYLKREWLAYWLGSGKPIVKNSDAAFLGFCKTWYEKRGRA